MLVSAFCTADGPFFVFTDFARIFTDEIRNNQYKYLFRPNSLVSGKEDAANNYARGYYTIGREVIKTVAEAIRREVNLCDSLDGFFFFHSMGGGTGSGLSTLILETLSEDYVKKKQLEFVVYPSPRVCFLLILIEIMFLIVLKNTLGFFIRNCFYRLR